MCRGCVGSAAKPAGKDPLEQLLPDLITFLLTHPHVKSMKQVGCLTIAAVPATTVSTVLGLRCT